MPENQPTPLSRGIEIRSNRIEEMRQWALGQYRDIVSLDNIIGQRIDAEMQNPLGSDSLDKLQELFQKKHALDEISVELEEMILKSYESQDVLIEQRLALEERLSAFAERNSEQEK